MDEGEGSGRGARGQNARWQGEATGATSWEGK